MAGAGEGERKLDGDGRFADATFAGENLCVGGGIV